MVLYDRPDPTKNPYLKLLEQNGHGSGHLPPEWEMPTPLIDWVEAYGTGDDPARWLAEPLLPDAGAVAIFAKGGTGKSLLALWIAAGLSTGCGLTGPCEPIDVLYLDYEMTIRDVVERLEDMGHDDPEGLGRLHYASLPTLPALDTVEGGKAVLSLAQHVKAKLVVVDTFSRAVRGEENEADTVRNWYRWTGQLLKAAGIAFLRIDHAGKDSSKGQRGTSAKNDDVDVVWEMAERGHGEYVLKATKRRVAWVEQQVILQRTEDNGVLEYRWDDGGPSWLGGTKEVADELDALGAAVDISRRKAILLLRANGHGRNNNVVADALRWRRERSGTRVKYHVGKGFTAVPSTESGTEPSPQVVPAEYQPVPIPEPDCVGGAVYEVHPPTQASPVDPNDVLW